MSLSLNWAAQQINADQKPIEELKAKSEAGDAESQVELGLRYDKGEGVLKDHAGGCEVLSQSRRTEMLSGFLQRARKNVSVAVRVYNPDSGRRDDPCAV